MTNASSHDITPTPEIIATSLRIPRPLYKQLRLLAAAREQSVHATILDAIGDIVQPQIPTLRTPNPAE
jgi:electron transfer flavoprotein alpha/beta subunit